MVVFGKEGAEVYCTVADLARATGIQRKTIDLKLAQGKLPVPTHRVGQRICYTEAEVEFIRVTLLEMKKLKTDLLSKVTI